MALLGSSKTVLILTDDALNIYQSKGKSISFYASISWDEDMFSDLVRNIITKDLGKAPVIVLNDMVEQHYRKERLPKVGVLDKSSVLQRRLQVAFPTYPVRAALQSKQKGLGANDKVAGAANKGDLFLFAAVPNSEPFEKTLAVIRSSYVRIIGFGLLPIESADMVHTLAKKLGGEEKGKTHWAIFVGHHQNGGLRQVITRNGELALTRMTAMADKNVDPGLWAKEVSGELRATMSYLARFGYSSDDVLDIMIVSAPESEKHLKAMIEIPCRLHIILAQEAAQSLGIKIAGQEDQKYADAIHASWVAAKNSMTLPMRATQISSIAKPQQVAMLAMIVLFVASIGLLYLNATALLGFMSSRGEYSELETRLQRVELEYQEEVKKKEELGLDVQLIQYSMASYDELQEKRAKPLPVIQKMIDAVGHTVRLDLILFEPMKPERSLNLRGRSRGKKAEEEKTDYTLTIQLSFRPDTIARDAVSQVETLAEQLRTAFTESEVTITDQPFDMDVSSPFVGETEDIGEINAAEIDTVAKIEVKGGLI